MGATDQAADALRAAGENSESAVENILNAQTNLGLLISNISAAGDAFAQQYGSILRELSDNIVRDVALYGQLRSALRDDVARMIAER
jgi:hypothetical protein